MSRQFSFNFTPALPTWAIVTIAAALCLLLLQGSLALRRKQVPGKWIARLAVLRVMIVIALVLCLVQPSVSYLRRVQRKPDLLMLVDTSQSMGQRATPDGQTRLDAARSTLRRGGLLKHLEENFDVRWFAFDRDAYPMEPADLDRLQPKGDATHFAASLTTAAAYQRQRGAAADRPTRALLVSDGDDSETAQDLAATALRLGVQVDTLMLDVPAAAPQPPRIALAATQAPQRVKLGSEMLVTATLRAEGNGPAPAGRELILLDGAEVVASGPVVFAAGSREIVVRLSHRPGKAAVHACQLQLKGEANSPPYAFTVVVADDRHQVLVLEDNWRWELKYLRRVVEDDPAFSFTAFLSRGGGAMHAQLAEADRKVTLAGFPQGAADLAWFDTIVLGDVSPRRWPPMLAAALARAVRDEGKSLVFIAGPNLATIAQTPELGGLLPVEVAQQSATPIEGPLQVRPSREGAASPFFFELPGSDLPELDRIYPPLRKRPAATVLLEAAQQANANGNLIVLAEHTVGRGRVLFVGTDALWNWQMTGPLDGHGVTLYAAFWQQAMRAMSPARPHGGDVEMFLQTDRSRYAAGERVRVTARYTSSAPIVSPTVQGTVTLPGQRQLPLAFAPDPAEANAYHAEFEPGVPGHYQITGGIGPQGKALAAQSTAMIDVHPGGAEISSADIDRANLARIAEVTRGKQVNPNDPSTWPAAAANAVTSVDEMRHVDLWGNLTLLIALCGLLGVDWLVRLVRGYT